MTIQLSPMTHMDAVVPDAQEAHRLLSNLFGARKIQQDRAAFFSSDQSKVTHIGIGDFVIQYLEPIAKEGPCYTQLATKGSGIHSLSFTVDDIDEAVRVLTEEEGIDTLYTYELDWEKLLQSDFTNPKAGTVYVMDTMALIGFHLSLSELPGESDPITPRTQYVTGKDKLIGDASTLLHFELAIADTEKAFDFLHRVFGTEKVELDFADLLDSPFMGITHMNLSNVVLQYCQPHQEAGSWYELLKKTGTYVHNITFLVDDIAETVKKFQEENTPQIFEGRLAPDAVPFYMMDTIDKLGFHLENGQAPREGVESGASMDWLFTDFHKESAL